MSGLPSRKGELLELLYSAPGEPGAWNEVTGRIATMTGARLGALLFIDPSSRRSSIQSHFGWPSDALRQYEEYFGAKDAWYAGYRKANTPGWIGLGSSLCPPGELERTEFYADFLRKSDTYHQCGVILDEGLGRLTVLTMNRSKHEPDFDDNQLRFLHGVTPHLKRTLHLHKEIVGWQNAALSAADLADSLDIGLIGLDGEGRVCFANRHIEALVQSRKLFRLRQGRLLVENPLDQATLDQLFRTANSLEFETPAGGAITLSDAAGSVHLSILPYRKGGNRLPNKVSVLVTITDLAAKPHSREQSLAELFKLTPAEARISMLLASGFDLAVIAERTRTTLHTVRSHLKAIYQKTNVTKQAQLVRLISLLPGKPSPPNG